MAYRFSDPDKKPADCGEARLRNITDIFMRFATGMAGQNFPLDVYEQRAREVAETFCALETYGEYGIVPERQYVEPWGSMTGDFLEETDIDALDEEFNYEDERFLSDMEMERPAPQEVINSEPYDLQELLTDFMGAARRLTETVPDIMENELLRAAVRVKLGTMFEIGTERLVFSRDQHMKLHKGFKDLIKLRI